MILTAISHEDHAAVLTMWSLQVAVAEREELTLFWCAPGSTIGEPETLEPGSEKIPAAIHEAIATFRKDAPAPPEGSEVEGEDWPKVTLRIAETTNAFRTVSDEIESLKPSLLITGKERSTRSSGATPATHLARRLFDSAHCHTLLFRLGSNNVVPSCARILVPAAGGTNSRRALRIGERLANCGEGSLTPLYVQPDIDDVAKEVGEQILEHSLTRARIAQDSKHVTPKVILSNDVDAGIREEAASGSYDLILVGAANSGGLRRTLFGTVPDRVLGGEGPTTVAVVRRARPLTHRIREKLERTLDLTFPQLRRSERIDLFEELQNKSRWSFDFMALICLSTAIAALGLIQNSTAVVIGAMLVAPLMTPLLGTGLALAQGNFPLAKKSLRAIVLGFLCAVLIGVITGFLARPFTGLTPEMVSRGGPSLLDMGVAFFSGIAASYCIARPSLSSALAGVAIAAALVPPVATVGISLAFGETANAKGASLLFGTNVIAIILGAAINFYLAGIRGKKSNTSTALWGRRIALALIACLAALAVPLSSTIIARAVEYSHHQRGRALTSEIRESLAETLTANFPGATIHQITMLPGESDTNQVELTINAPSAPGKPLHTLLQNHLTKTTGNPVKLHLLTRLAINPEP